MNEENILFIKKPQPLINDHPGRGRTGERKVSHIEKSRICKKTKCMQAVKGWGWASCAQAPGMRRGCSVCSAQCTVIRTQPALTPPGQMPHSAASTCLPCANCTRVALAATSGSRTGQGGRLQAGPGCPLRGRGILRAGPGYPQAAGPHYLRQPANTRVVFNSIGPACIRLASGDFTDII